jgi:hypothetical protein
MKKLFFLMGTILFTAFQLSAQKIEFVKDKVLVYKTDSFDFVRKDMGSEFTLYKLNSKNEIVYMTQNTNGTREDYADDYIKFVFVDLDIIVEAGRFHGKSWKTLIALLLEENVIDKVGNINAENLQRFATKYDDKIREKK